MLQIDHLFKNYGKFRAVNNLSLHIPRGDLFGFVGPNGAGKTTTIRMVCGLMLPTSGNITINGVDAVAHQKEIKKQIGYVPDFYGALILNPALLVLDEPNSGLDPRARVEMKELLLNLKGMGKTIVISSHILSELSEMCNSIGIMDHGNLVAAGLIEDVMDSVFGSNQLIITLEGGQETALRIANEHAGVKVTSVGEQEMKLTHSMTKPEIAKMIGEMIAHDVVVTGFHKQEGSLETLFMRVTDNEEEQKGGQGNAAESNH